MTPREEALLRDRLWEVRLQRAIAHERVSRESAVTRRLHAELHATERERQKLSRRARWLLSTKRPLPRMVPR
jgi:hypothetical protein